MILRITRKLGDKIKEPPSQSVPFADNPFADWTANLFYADRAQYIIIANTLSLYSVIVAGRGITDGDRFIKTAISTLRDFVRRDGNGIIYNEYMKGEMGSFRFAKTRNRRIIGSLNQVVREAKIFLVEHELSPYQTSFRLNGTLLSFLGDDEERYSYGKPREAFRDLVGRAGEAAE